MVSQTGFRQFDDFALVEIRSGGVTSPEQCLCDGREFQETVAAIREGLEESRSGRSQSVEDAFADIRRELGLLERRPIS